MEYDKQVGKRLAARHCFRWRQLNAARRQAFDARAVDVRDERRAALANVISECKAQVDVLRLRVEEAKRRSPPCRMSSCRLSSDDLVRLESLFGEGKTFTGDHVEKLRDDALEHVGPPPPAERAVLESMVVARPPGPAGRAPHWASWLAHNRDDLSSSLFRYHPSDGGIRYFKFVYAMQNPVFFAMLSLEYIERPEAGDIPGAACPSEAFEWTGVFRCTSWDMLFSDSGALDDVRSQVYVCMDSTHVGGDRYLAAGQWVPIEFLLLRLPWPDRSKGVAADVEPAERMAASVDNLPPWVEEELLWDPSNWKCLEDAGKCPHERAKEKVSAETCVDVDDVIDELVEKRKDIGMAAIACTDFKIVVRGGRYTKANFGVPYDSIRAEAASSLAREFCASYNMQKSATYALRSYGEAFCLVLANSWASRMQQFLDMWVRSGVGNGFSFTSAVLGTVGETKEFRELCAQAKGGALQRAEAIRGMRPWR